MYLPIVLAPSIVLGLFYLYLLFTFRSAAGFILNAVLLLILYFLIVKDLKDPDNQKYYIGSLVLTALFFILSTTNVFAMVLLIAEKLLLSYVTVAAFLVYGFAHVIALIYEFVNHKWDEKHK